MKLELERPAATTAERMTVERVTSVVATVLLLWVERILSTVILFAHFWKCPNFMSNFGIVCFSGI